MIITTSRSRPAWLIDIGLTLIAWTGFTYLFAAGVVSILSSTTLRAEGIVTTTLLPTLHTLAYYIFLAIINACLLIVWAQYNFHRHKKSNRRKSNQVIRSYDLAQQFQLDIKTIDEITIAKTVYFQHDILGNIKKVISYPSKVTLEDITTKEINSLISAIPHTQVTHL